MKRNILIGLVLVVVIIAAGVGYVLNQARQQAIIWTHPARAAVTVTPEDAYGLANWEEVSFTTSDDLTLRGWFITPDAQADGATVVLVHGLGGSRTDMLDRAFVFAAHGYHTLLFDLRNHGESDGTVTSLGYSEVDDVRAALAYLQTRPEVDMSRVALVGHSMGGATVLRAGARIPEVAVVVSEAGYQSVESIAGHIITILTGRAPWPMMMWFVDQEAGVPASEVNGLQDVAQIAPRPLMFVHGEQDNIVFLSDSQAMYEAASDPKALYVVPGADHVNLVSIDLEGYAENVVSFLDAHLR